VTSPQRQIGLSPVCDRTASLTLPYKAFRSAAQACCAQYPSLPKQPKIRSSSRNISSWPRLARSSKSLRGPPNRRLRPSRQKLRSALLWLAIVRRRRIQSGECPRITRPGRYPVHECDALEGRAMRGQSVTSRKAKKRGSPARGKGEPLLVRLQKTPLAALDHWIARQEDRPSRPEAIRRLVEQALAGSSPGPRSPAARAKATDLASKRLDELIDPATPEVERQQRKRRILRGPGEFRELRDKSRSKDKN